MSRCVASADDDVFGYVLLYYMSSATLCGILFHFIVMVRADVSGYPSERRLTCPNLRPPKSPPSLLKVGTATRVGCNLPLRRAIMMTMLPHVKGVYHLCMF